jgi:hypothetical protein
MSEVFDILACKGLPVLGNTRLRIILIALAALVVLAVLGVAIASAMHPHMIAPLASGQAWAGEL